MKADYTERFLHADEVIKHLNTVVPTISNHLLVQKYVGFVSVVAVTVYELAIQNIFIESAKKTHQEFGVFAEAWFDKINGRIKLKNIKTDYLSKFCEERRSRFEKNLEKKSSDSIRENGRDITSAYGSVIATRNTFVHAPNIQSHVTYVEIVKAYEDGKKVIHCLAEAMAQQK